MIQSTRRSQGEGRRDKALPAPLSGPGPHHTSSRSVRALGFSRYFSRARQAEMRSGLSSILPVADKRGVDLGSTHLSLLGAPYSPHPAGVLGEALNTLHQGTHPVLPGLTRVVESQTPFPGDIILHSTPRGRHGEHTDPKRKWTRGPKFIPSGQWQMENLSLRTDFFFIRGKKKKRHTQDGKVWQMSQRRWMA